MSSPFLRDLAQFGPDQAEPSTLEVARAYCARLTTIHYENFSVVNWLTPRALRPAFASVYAFCRWSDDLGDEIGDPARSRELLLWWRGQLADLYEGRVRHPVFVALAETVREFAIPIGPFLDLISAFEQDQIITEYETYEQLLDYCRRSANPVGELVLRLGRACTEENARLSGFTCTALQLANFWQDVSRDLDIGRVYIPREDRIRFGYEDQDLRRRDFNPAFASLLEFEVARTRALFRQGWPLIARMPRELAIDVELFSRGGMAILDRIERQGYDVMTRRPRLGKLAKASLLGRALLARSGLIPAFRGRVEAVGQGAGS